MYLQSFAFLIDCELFATINTIVILLATDLTSNTENDFFNSMLSTKIPNIIKNKFL